MKNNNAIIRGFLESNGVAYWMLADMLGISDSSFSRILRKEIPADIQNKMVDALKKCIAGEKFSIDFYTEWRMKNIVQANQRKAEQMRKAKSEFAARVKVNKMLDEAEERRIAGGWDLSL